MTGETDDGLIFTPQYVYSAEPGEGGVKHLSFSTAMSSGAYLEADLLAGDKSERVFNDQMFAILANGYVRFFGTNIYTKNLIKNKWYLVDILLNSETNKAQLYIDGELTASADLPSYPSDSIKGAVFVKKSLDMVYLDDISLTADSNAPSVSVMSDSPYYANMLSDVSGTIDTYSQNKARFIEKLRLEGVSDAVLLNSDGTANTDTVMSTNKYLRLTTDEGKNIYYLTKQGTDSYLSGLDSVDTQNDTNRETEGYYVYEQPDISKLKGSPLDVSFILDAPAGKHGFVKRSGDGFIFGDTNEEIKFWGTNLGGDQIFLDSHADAEALADRIAAAGFNLVRIHNFDTTSKSRGILRINPDTNKVEIDPDKMDKLCYLLSEFKERGIYWYLDQIVSRPIYDEDNADYHDTTSMFPAGFWNQSLIDIQNEYSKSLLEYTNPYTGIRLIDDPALAMIDLVNEKEIFNADLEGAGSYYNELNVKFSEWLKTKYTNRASLNLAWYSLNSYFSLGLLDSEDPWTDGKPVQVMNTTPKTEGAICRGNANTKRANDICKFLTEVEQEFCQKRTEYLRGIGVKCPISGGTAWGAQETEHFYALTGNDFISMHQYWSHPSVKSSITESGMKYDGRSQLEVAYNTSDKNDSLGIIGTLSTDRVFGMPYMIEEWNLCPPNSYVAEGPLMMSAYGSLNNWNALHFAFGGKGYIDMLNAGEDIGYDNPFSSIENPVQTAVFPAASIMFQRGDVKEAESGYYSVIEQNDIGIGFNNNNIWAGIHSLPNDHDGHIGLIGKTGVAYNVNGLSNGLVSDENIKNAADNADSGDRKFVSSTGELTADLGNKLFKADTAGSQAVCGFIGGKKISLSNADISVNNEYAYVSLTSLSDSSINTGSRLLLTLAGEAKCYGQIIEQDSEKNTEIKIAGKAPIMTEQITGEITLKLNGSYSVYALTSSGERKMQVPVSYTDGGFKLNITRDMETMYFEIVKD